MYGAGLPGDGPFAGSTWSARTSPLRVDGCCCRKRGSRDNWGAAPGTVRGRPGRLVRVGCGGAVLTLRPRARAGRRAGVVVVDARVVRGMRVLPARAAVRRVLLRVG